MVIAVCRWALCKALVSRALLRGCSNTAGSLRTGVPLTCWADSRFISTQVSATPTSFVYTTDSNTSPVGSGTLRCTANGVCSARRCAMRAPSPSAACMRSRRTTRLRTLLSCLPVDTAADLLPFLFSAPPSGMVEGLKCSTVPRVRGGGLCFREKGRETGVFLAQTPSAGAVSGWLVLVQV
jgi:hypothetical protein